MAKYFSLDYLLGEFGLFSLPHILAILAIAVLNVLIVVWLRQTKAARKPARYGLAGLLIAQELSLHLWYAYTGQWSLGQSLPLHLCGAAVILSVVVLVSKSYPLYELTYFWGFGGAIQALLTPNMTYGFPHYRFWQFFISHGAIVTASVLMTFVEGFRPTIRSIWKTFAITNAYMVLVAGLNLLVGGNYLFICYKPETPSLLDYLGPWPWYILSLEAVGMLSFFVYYAPFALKDLLDRRGRASAAVPKP
ncbi:MAG: TIGR02206 family membrane protein [Chloroflexi bacterium]|jgi:hypothetical integral membrane protein (TIGR02206 family)|nr:TIGR02206 family membrane protein [Chloroflexota bacterium]